MFLDLDRQPLDLGIERRTLGHRPRVQHAAELEAQIVVHPSRGMLLNHEQSGALPGALERLGGLFRGPLGPVAGQPVPLLGVGRSHAE
jgi:hypothetical protein